jgi:hypothetical protein
MPQVRRPARLSTEGAFRGEGVSSLGALIPTTPGWVFLCLSVQGQPVLKHAILRTVRPFWCPSLTSSFALFVRMTCVAACPGPIRQDNVEGGDRCGSAFVSPRGGTALPTVWFPHICHRRLPSEEPVLLDQARSRLVDGLGVLGDMRRKRGRRGPRLGLPGVQPWVWWDPFLLRARPFGAVLTPDTAGRVVVAGQVLP